MTRLVFFFVVAMVVVFADTANAARRAFVVDQAGIPVASSNGSSPTLAETRDAIIAGAKKLGWLVREDVPGNIKLQLNNAGASVVIDVPYRAGSFDIRYVTSDGLRFSEANGKRTIHGSYKRWVDNLIGSIAGASRSSGSTGAPSPGGDTKLEDLPLPPPGGAK